VITGKGGYPMAWIGCAEPDKKVRCVASDIPACASRKKVYYWYPTMLN